MGKKRNQTKDEAIDSVMDGDKDYYFKCLSFAYCWVTTQFKPFTSEDLKKAYFDIGNDPPREPKLFGAIFRALNREKKIFHHSYSVAKNKVAHGRILRKWISLEYSLKQ